MKSLMPQIDSNDGLFHNGNPATGEQGTRVTDTWLNNLQDRVRDVQAEAHYVLQKAGFTPKAETQTQLYQAIVKIIDDNRKTASLTQKGEVQLSSSTNSDSETQAATSKAAKTAYDKAVEAKTAADNAQHTADSKQSPATTLAGYGIGDLKIQSFAGDINTLKIDGIYAITQAGRSQNLPVSTSCHIQVIAGGDGSWCRQLAYVAYSTDMYERHQTSYQTDSWSAWKKLNTDGIPVGAVVSFPRAVTNPVGFLKANGTTFNQQTFPDLYQVLGNSNQLPDLTRSDVGMTAYFAVDNIPNGWIAFDEIATQVTEQRYPELYRHLIGKYGSINSVPKVADRFLRNAGNGLSVGQTQEDAIRNITGKFGPVDGGGRHTGAFRQEESFGYGATLGDSRWWVSFDASRVVPIADENRPKSLVLKLCIKAINSLDDVVFWIKSHGEVTNAGALDAGRLAQGLQDKADRNHTHTASQITDFNQATSQIINAAITYQKIGDIEVRKYPDGTMIQTCRKHMLTGDYSKVNFNWAVAFTEMPILTATAQYFNSVGDHDTIITFVQGTSNSACHLVCGETYNNNGEIAYVNIIAIGRWKR
jgi:phage tail collar domain protein|nr:MAG TPA: tail fiber protein [Caudoviricetes sp.]